MIAYKLFKKRKDGTLGPLFINARQRVPMDVWLDYEDHPTKGFAHRPGWHCTLEAHAPHLKLTDNRVWCKIAIEGPKYYERPESQGGKWVLASRIKVLEELPRD